MFVQLVTFQIHPIDRFFSRPGVLYYWSPRSIHRKKSPVSTRPSRKMGGYACPKKCLSNAGELSISIYSVTSGYVANWHSANLHSFFMFVINSQLIIIIVYRASKLKGHKIERSPYLLKKQSGAFYGEFLRRKNNMQQLLSSDYNIE